MALRISSRAALAAMVATVVVVSGAGVWALWRVFVLTLPGRRVDHLAMEGALHGQVTLWGVAERVLEPVSVVYGAVAVVVVVSIAVLRRRYAMAVEATVLLGGSVLTTQVLKRFILSRPDLGDMPHLANALPSGHTTAAAATSAALLYVATPRWRPAVAVLGVVYTVATGWSTLIGQWHRPADVMAAVLVVTAWSAAASLSMLLRTGSGTTATTQISVVRTGPSAADRIVTVLGSTGTVALGVTVATGMWVWKGTVTGTAGDLVAYGGGVAAIVAAVCVGVAIQLALREAVGRVVRDPQGSRTALPQSDALLTP
jgi:hypothetical protein